MPKSKTSSEVDRVPCNAFSNEDAEPPKSPEAYAAFLEEHGYVVISVPWFAGKQNACRMRKEFEQEVIAFPEFTVRPNFDQVAKYPGNATKYDDTLAYRRYGLGGTSFLGAASVFHNMFVRRMREKVMHTVIECLFQAYVRDILMDTRQEYNIQQFVDRVMIRPKFDSASPEGWHRDEAPGMAKDDKTYGGWINLDTEDQFLSCAPSTHKRHLHIDRPYVRGENGFSKIDKKDHPVYKGASTRIRVPPGCILVFQEDLVHEVMSMELTYTSVRQFFGWRLTKETTIDLKPNNKPRKLNPDEFRELFHDQAVIPIKSGQMPEMYPTSFNDLYKKIQLPRWHKFKHENMVPNVMPPESEKGKNNYMKSLRQLHHEGSITMMHPDYDDRELAILVPGKHFVILNPRTGEREPVSLHDSVEGRLPRPRTHAQKERPLQEEDEVVFLQTKPASKKMKKRKIIESSSSDSSDDVVYMKTQQGACSKHKTRRKK